MFTNRDSVEQPPARHRNVRGELLQGDRNSRGRTWYPLHQEDSQGRNYPTGETPTIGRVKDQGE